MIEQIDDEEARRARHKQRIEEMRRIKQKQMRRRMYFKKFAPLVLGVFIIVLIITGVIKIVHKTFAEKQNNKENSENLIENESIDNTENVDGTGEQMSGDVQASADGQASIVGQGLSIGQVVSNDQAVQPPKTYQASETADTVQLGEYLDSDQEFFSDYAILIDLSDDSIIAEKYAKTRINPASMTKILTVLVAAEHIDTEDLDDKFTMTLEITDYGYSNDCSSAGFENDETISVRELFYGTVLPSGADAAVGLATYVAGSQEAFVEMMNDKLEELGLSKTTHFTNCVGVYDEEHYSTVYDMAMIMEAAMDNEFCREVMSAHTYTTMETEQHPEGIILSNWFLRKIEDKEGGEKVICAKTGYVVQSKNCAASYAVDSNGDGYICVTAHADSSWRCIYDHANLYKKFLP